jgi:hypothetical protein
LSVVHSFQETKSQEPATNNSSPSPIPCPTTYCIPFIILHLSFFISFSPFPKEALIKSHRGRCVKNGPRARRLGTSIPSVGCRSGCEATAGQAKCQANAVGPRATPRSQRLCGLWLGSPQPKGLKPFVDFCLAVSRRSRPADCFAGYDAAPAARRCGVARSGETAAGIAQHSRLQKSANALQRPPWDLISASLSVFVRSFALVPIASGIMFSYRATG